MEPVFFAQPSDFRTWLERHHEGESELLVGFYKKGSKRPSITWPESVDEALCFGWIDGVRRRVDDVSYSIRFTPRKAKSTWSAVNVKRVAELEKRGLLRPAGERAFAGRAEERSGIYAYEQKETARFNAAQRRQFRTAPKAWDFFQAQAPWYRRTATWWVVSAKRDETRARRLATLIEDSAHGRRLRQLTPPGKRG